VLDLEAIAVHRGSVIGAVPGKSQPSQKYFDSLLQLEMTRFDPAKPVWVEAESKKIGNVQLPVSLLETMRLGVTIEIDTTMEQRVLLWREDYRHFEEDPKGLVERLAFLRQQVGGEELAAWEDMATQRQIPQLFERIMRNHYDPAYRRSILRNYPAIDSSPRIALADLSTQGLLPVAQSMRDNFEK
jgi:tRNA 2-selenouridine synthase